MNNYIYIDKCRPGDIVAKDIYDARGALLLAKGATLNDFIIEKLKHNHAINKLPLMEDFEIDASFLEDTDSKQKNSYNEYKQKYIKSVEIMKNITDCLIKGEKLEYPEIQELSHYIYFDNKEISSSVLECVAELKSTSDYIYTHSINVAIYSMLIGRWLGLQEAKIKDLIQAGLLHDIGKIKIPSSILNKEGKLLPGEYDVMKTHTILGYEMTKDIDELSHNIKLPVLLHHEREDGSGYPFELKGNKLNLYTKIVAIADVYDAITSSKLYGKKFSPFEAFSKLETGLDCFDTKILLSFIANIANYYVGIVVKFDTGEEGKVVYIPPQSPSTPVVQVEDSFIDLSVEKTRRIVDTKV